MRSKKRRTFHSVVAPTGKHCFAINRKHQRPRLGAFGVRALDCHAWAHKVGLGLPHVQRTVQAGWYNAIDKAIHTNYTIGRRLTSAN